MGKQEILDELNELLNIPQFERIVFHKVEELKLFLKDEIDFYRDIKSNFKKSAYGDLGIIEGDEWIDNSSQTYHFELSCSESQEWIAVSLEPSPPPGYDTYDILPLEMIRYMSTYATEPDKIHSEREYKLPDLIGKAFDLRFTKYSDSHILGTLKAYKAKESDSAELESDAIPTNQIYHYNQYDAGDENNYKELMYYMKKYPALKAYFFTELNMKMKPLIIGNLVNFTSSSQPVDLF
jgi:hypothetical protein